MKHLKDLDKAIADNKLHKIKKDDILSLFESEKFTLTMNIYYLNQRIEQGIQSYLINKLYNWNYYDIEFHLPQLCFMLIKRKSDDLEKFLLNLCAKNSNSFLKIFFYLRAYGQSERNDKKAYEYVEDLVCKAERTMVNGTLYPDLIYTTTPENQLENVIKEETMKKKLRSEYLAETLKFMNILVTVSLMLKKHKIEDRKKICRSFMHRLNKWLAKLRKKHVEDKYFCNLFKGIQLPFAKTSDNENSSMIVNILEDNIICFNTKKRVPYKIVVETVDIKDFEIFEPKSSDKEKLIASDINSDIDNWEDVALERQAMKNEQSQKTDDNKLEEYNNLQRKNGNPKKTVMFAPISDSKFMQTEEKKLDNSSPKTILKSPIEDDKKIEDLNSQLSFGHEFRLSRKLLRRTSIDNKTENLINPTRKLSDPKPSDAEAINHLTRFRQTISKKTELAKIDKIIDDLSQKIIEDQKVKYLSSAKIQKWKFGPWDELWEYKKTDIQEKSCFGHFPSYKLRCLIVKGNDDLRQELIAMQLIKMIDNIWKSEGLTLKLRPYDIMVVSEDSGIIEFIPDTFSIDALKKKGSKKLKDFYEEVFGDNFEEAQKNFMDSLAGYSLVCYFLQIKDRHNGNILIDAHGHLIHIDFGFILTTSPGAMNFESAPFKLTQEYVDLMGGLDSDTFNYFKLKVLQGFMTLRNHVESLLYILKIMMNGSDLPCLQQFDASTFKSRFKLKLSDKECMKHVEKLIDNSYDNWRTVQYDNFQKMTNNILP